MARFHSLLLCATLLSSGCSFLAPGTQRLFIRTSEPDAKVYLNGSLIGQGSLSYQVNRGQKVEVTVQKEGFFPGVRTIERSLSVPGRLDAVGTYLILVPALGLMSPGAYQLDTTEIDIRLIEIPKWPERSTQ